MDAQIYRLGRDFRTVIYDHRLTGQFFRKQYQYCTCDRYPMTWSETAQGSKGNSQARHGLWIHSYGNVITAAYSSKILDMAIDGHVQYSSISSRKRDSVFFHPCKIISKDQDLFSDPVFKPHISLNLKFLWMGRKRRFLKWFLELSASRRSVVQRFQGSHKHLPVLRQYLIDS
jgi:hypothetical protein